MGLTSAGTARWIEVESGVWVNMEQLIQVKAIYWDDTGVTEVEVTAVNGVKTRVCDDAATARAIWGYVVSNRASR